MKAIARHLRPGIAAAILILMSACSRPVKPEELLERSLKTSVLGRVTDLPYGVLRENPAAGYVLFEYSTDASYFQFLDDVLPPGKGPYGITPISCSDDRIASKLARWVGLPDTVRMNCYYGLIELDVHYIADNVATTHVYHIVGGVRP
ncbi:MAG TPA: hypothetical protein PLL45_05175 [Thermoflexales bacterium]|nr:hypothetical protein [Thermoflexales bacterium]